MKTLLVSLSSFALTLVFATAALAQANINECEKIQAADAYNQCLAKFGPPAKSGNLEPERPGDVKSSAEEAAAGAGKASRGKGRVSSRRHGRGATAHRSRGGGHSRGSRASHGRKRMTIKVGK